MAQALVVRIIYRSMQSVRNPVKPLWLALLALLALVSEAAAWWWAGQLADGASLQGPILLGLAGGLCAMAVFVVLWRQIPAARLETTQTRQLLASSLDTLDVGLEIWDAHDRLMLYNKKINQIYPDFHTPAHIGQTFEALARARLKRQQIPMAVGREEQWLAQHLAARGRHKEPRLKELADNRWVNTCETRTPEGYLVASWVDVTALVHQSKVLEASNRQLAQQSTMDQLTGLANRRRFDEALVTEWQRAARSVTPLSLLMVDIDHFKQYNDNYGHVAGDECLRRVAGVLEQCVRRAGEMVARYGGEEFVMLLPGADMDHACDTAQKCLQMMQREVVPHVASPTAGQVTFSIGVACLLPDATLEPTTMVNAADAAMYRAKTGGRARFEVADQADWEIDKDTPRTRPTPLA
jgi:diguanylate cyclase (GGDEF)-like protein